MGLTLNGVITTAIRIRKTKKITIPSKERLLVPLKATIDAISKINNRAQVSAISGLTGLYGPNRIRLNINVLKGSPMHGEYRSVRKRWEKIMTNPATII